MLRRAQPTGVLSSGLPRGKKIKHWALVALHVWDKLVASDIGNDETSFSITVKARIMGKWAPQGARFPRSTPDLTCRGRVVELLYHMTPMTHDQEVRYGAPGRACVGKPQPTAVGGLPRAVGFNIVSQKNEANAGCARKSLAAGHRHPYHYPTTLDILCWVLLTSTIRW